MKRRIEQLQNLAKSHKMKDSVRFFDSKAEYQKALRDGNIRDHHICIVDDIVEDDEEMIKKGYVKYNEG